MDPLATVGELETHLGKVVDVDAGTQAVTLASGAVRAYCGWGLARETVTFHVSGGGTQILTLPTLHLVELAAIRCGGIAVDLDPYTGLTWTRKGQIYRPSAWSLNSDYEVDVVHGYDPIPDLIKLVVLDLASKQTTNPEGLIAATVGQVSRTWQNTNTPKAMSTLHERLLDRYAL